MPVRPAPVVALVLGLVLGLSAVGDASGAVVRVPRDVSSVQGAIDLAASGDTILVAEGLYREGVASSKGVVLLGGWSADYSRRDPALFPVIVDADGKESAVFRFFGSSGGHVVVDGFVIRNGWFDGGNGGGILINGDWSAEIRNNSIVHNYARYHGGGLCFLRGARGVVENNVFERNSVIFHGGGMALLEDASAEIRGNIFDGNRVLFDSGGGVAVLKRCRVTIGANRFVRNDARMRGGAVSFLQEVEGSVEGNVMVENRCGYKGGAVSSWKSSLECTRNTLVRNYSPVSGGIRADGGGEATISGNVFVRSPGPWLLREGGVELTVAENIVWIADPPSGAVEPGGTRRVDPMLCDDLSDQRPRRDSPCLEQPLAGCYETVCGEPPRPGEPPLDGANRR